MSISLPLLAAACEAAGIKPDKRDAHMRARLYVPPGAVYIVRC